MLTGDPCDPLYQVRLIIGDAKEEAELVSDEIIQYALSLNSNSVKPAAIQVLDWVLANLASLVTHSVGEVYIDTRKLYDQVKDLRDRLIRNPSFMGGLPIIVGGTSKKEEQRVNTDSDFLGSPIQRGFGTE